MSLYDMLNEDEEGDPRHVARSAVYSNRAISEEESRDSYSRSGESIRRARYREVSVPPLSSNALVEKRPEVYDAPRSVVRITQPSGGISSAKSIIYGNREKVGFEESSKQSRQNTPVAFERGSRTVASGEDHRYRNFPEANLPSVKSLDGPFSKVYKKRVFKAFQECRGDREKTKCSSYLRVLQRRQWRVHQDIADNLISKCNDGDGTMTRTSLIRAVLKMDEEWSQSRTNRSNRVNRTGSRKGNVSSSPTVVSRLRGEISSIANTPPSPQSNRSPLGRKLRNAGLAELNGVTDEMRQKRREAQLELQRSLAAQIAAKQRRKMNVSKSRSPRSSGGEYMSRPHDAGNENAIERGETPVAADVSSDHNSSEMNERSRVLDMPSSAPSAARTSTSLEGPDADALTNLYLKLQRDHSALEEKFFEQQEHLVALIEEREKWSGATDRDASASNRSSSSFSSREERNANRKGREVKRLVRAGIVATSAPQEITTTTNPRDHPFWRRIAHFYDKHNPKMATQEKLSKLMVRHPGAAERANLLISLEKKYGFAVPPPRLGRRSGRKRLPPQERRARAKAFRSRRKKAILRKKEEEKIRRRNESIANQMRGPERRSVSRDFARQEDRNDASAGHARAIVSAESSSTNARGAWRGRNFGGLETSSPLDAKSSFLPVPAWQGRQ